MADEPGGPRDRLANERTQLAWLRTGANVIVIGLVVARFADGGDMSRTSVVAGALLIATGAVGVGYGTVRYRGTAAALHRGELGAGSSTAGPTIAAVVLPVTMVAATLLLLLDA